MSEPSLRHVALGTASIDLEYSAHSDRGTKRALNEDSHMAEPPLFIVADGMGGHAFGDRASQAAISAFADAFDNGLPAKPELILETIRRANEAVLGLTAGTEAEGQISGTTLVGVALVELDDGVGYRWMAFNLGDSRVYCWDGSALGQLSVDHSAVQELLESGEITDAQAAEHPLRSVVTRALGANAEADSDFWLLPVTGNQTFVLCSDGLTKELSDQEIARVMSFHYAAASTGDELAPTLAERLVDAAIAAGGSDNVTVIVVSSQLVDSDGDGGDSLIDTLERGGLPAVLEETRPRG